MNILKVTHYIVHLIANIFVRNSADSHIIGVPANMQQTTNSKEPFSYINNNEDLYSTYSHMGLRRSKRIAKNLQY